MSFKNPVTPPRFISDAIALYKDQVDLVDHFYNLHLDDCENFWAKHTVEEGAIAAMNETSAFVHEFVSDTHPFIEASASSGMGVTRLLVGIPVGLYSWGKQTVLEIPKGPAEVVYKFFEVPVTGLWHGSQYVGGQLLKALEIGIQLYNGEHVSLSYWEVAQGFVGTLGTFGIMFLGLSKVISGAGKMGGSFSTEFGPSTATNLATASTSFAVDLAKFGEGMGEVGLGAMMMASQEEISGALDKAAGEENANIPAAFRKQFESEASSILKTIQATYDYSVRTAPQATDLLKIAQHTLSAWIKNKNGEAAYTRYKLALMEQNNSPHSLSGFLKAFKPDTSPPYVRFLEIERKGIKPGVRVKIGSKVFTVKMITKDCHVVLKEDGKGSYAPSNLEVIP